MRKTIAIAAALVPGAAVAHPGHYAEAAGHTHWVALGALALAGVVTAVALARAARTPRSLDEASRDDA